MNAEPTPMPEVVIVSSDGRVRGLASIVLADEGWRTRAFASPEAGFRYLCGRTREVALLILDARADAWRAAVTLVQRARALRDDLHLMVLVSEEKHEEARQLDLLVGTGVGQLVRVDPLRLGSVSPLA
jgi:DNA-binding NtrC family response regulator